MNCENTDPTPGRPDQWHSRGYLPHRDTAHLLQSITFRLADSLPREKLHQLEQELIDVPEEKLDTFRRQRIEAWLDSGIGLCALQHPDVAEYVQNALKHFHNEKYDLIAWCIMPNHVHVLINPRTSVSKIVQGWKSFTARWILARNESLNLNLPDSRHLWMRDYWDRYIRNMKHYSNTVFYIHENPVEAGLCRHASDWKWSSAFREA